MEHEFSKVLEQQNLITLKLVDQQLKSSLPPRKIDVFDGNPLNYNVFIKSFGQTIEEKTIKIGFTSWSSSPVVRLIL